MRPLLGSAVLASGLLLVAAEAQADVVVRAPFVSVNVGPGVQVRAPFTNVALPPERVYYPVQPVYPPQPVIHAPQPVIYPARPVEYIGPPAEVPVATRVLTHKEFGQVFKPAPGNYEVVLLHPDTCCPVRICFTLPCGCPRVRIERHELEFDYGKVEVELRFRRNGTVRVEYRD